MRSRMPPAGLVVVREYMGGPESGAALSLFSCCWLNHRGLPLRKIGRDAFQQSILQNNYETHMISTTLASTFGVWDALQWSVLSVWRDQFLMWVTVGIVLVLLVGIGGGLWPWLWNKKWALWKADTLSIVGAAACIVLIGGSTLSLVGQGGFSARHALDKPITSAAEISTLNGDAYAPLRKLVFADISDPMKLAMFGTKNVTVLHAKNPEAKLMERKVNDVRKTKDGKQIRWTANEVAGYVKDCRDQMFAKQGIWKKSYMNTLYVALGGLVVYLAFIWWRAYTDIQVYPIQTEEPEEEKNETDEYAA